MGCRAILGPEPQQRLNKYFEIIVPKVFIAASLAVENRIVDVERRALIVPKRTVPGVPRVQANAKAPNISG